MPTIIQSDPLLGMPADDHPITSNKKEGGMLPAPSNPGPPLEKSSIKVVILDSVDQTKEQADLLAKAAELQRQLADTQRKIHALDNSSDPLKLKASDSNVPRAATRPQTDRSRYRTVQFFKDFKQASSTVKLVQSIFFISILSTFFINKASKTVRAIQCIFFAAIFSVTLLIDGVAYITASILEDVARRQIESGDLTKLANSTLQGTLTNEKTKKDAIEFVSNLIKGAGEKMVPELKTLLEDTETFDAVEKLLVKTLVSPEVTGGVKGLIHSNVTLLVDLAKETLSDKDLENKLSTLAAKVVADTTTGAASGVLRNTGNAFRNTACSVYASAWAGLNAIRGKPAVPPKDDDADSRTRRQVQYYHDTIAKYYEPKKKEQEYTFDS